MKFQPNDPPRKFAVGPKKDMVLHDCGYLTLAEDEQIRFDAGEALQVIRKPWGFSWGAPLNCPAVDRRHRAVLAKGPGGSTYFVLLVRLGQEKDLNDFLDVTGVTLVCWLDSDEALVELHNRLKGGAPYPTSE